MPSGGLHPITQQLTSIIDHCGDALVPYSRDCAVSASQPAPMTSDESIGVKSWDSPHQKRTETAGGLAASIIYVSLI